MNKSRLLFRRIVKNIFRLLVVGGIVLTATLAYIIFVFFVEMGILT